VLLGSVAALGLAVLVGGPTGRSIGLPAWTQSAYAAAASQSPSGFADIVAKVKPAVISVRVKLDASANKTSMNQKDDDDNATPFEHGPPMEKFFRQFGLPGMPDRPPHGEQPVSGEGSGFFISADGYAVTNHHVVDHAKTVKVTTDDGAIYDAKVVGTDPKTDLALIKVDADKSFAFVNFAENDPRVGDWVVAVGNPFGLGGTVTAGIVSARGRDIGSGPYDYVQIDAPINKGNSGGPAFNMDGSVIGVNTAIFSPSGGSVGIGFDIPASTAKMIVAQLKEHGSIERAWMGVQTQTVTADIANSLGLQKAEGALVDAAQPESPAAKAGIATGDVIVDINGMPVKDSRDLARKIGMMAPGTSIKLMTLHKGGPKTVDLTLGKMPEEQQAKAEIGSDDPAKGVPHLGLTLAPANDVDGSGGHGVAVVGVDPDGLAAEHGVKTGDVILDVGGKEVTNAADVRKALTDAQKDGKHTILMRVKSADATMFIALPLRKA
jgi:serine protease Do